MPKKIVVASGYFQPIHVGHIGYLSRAKSLGDFLIVIVNNDEQARMKHGYSFMPCNERIEIVRALECVDMVVESIDTDRTVCKTLEMLHPHIFTNGGDQTNDTIPEIDICEKMGIELVDGLGAKVQSSRWLIRKVKDSEYT